MIPQFSKSLVLPRFLGKQPGARLWTSPYQASMSEVVERYATSPARVRLLHGLLSYRDALLAAGLSDGYQRASLRWKGILKIPLASDDTAAKVQLKAIARKWEANHDQQSGI